MLSNAAKKNKKSLILSEELTLAASISPLGDLLI